MATDSSYEHSARFYDAAHAAMPSLGPDARFYEALAVEAGGPVLELGTGTGRVLLPIAARGLACTGIDASPAMLEQLRRKPDASGLELVCARMESFNLGGRFRLIFSAFRAFQHLDTVEQQLACLERVRAHLAPDGIFAFDVFNPRLERMVRDEEPEEQDLVFEFEGRRTRRFAHVTRTRATQIAHITFRYVTDASGTLPAEETSIRISMRWFWRYELEHLLARTGFSQVEVFGDFDRSPIGRNSPSFVVVAR